LCGSVRYSSDAQPKMTAICHCRSCQKAGGCGYSVIVAVPTDSIPLEGAPRSYATVGTSGQPVTRRFCSDCGSPCFAEAAAFAGLSFIKGGSRDDPSWLEPTLHIWCDSAQPWDPIPDHATRVGKTRGDTRCLCRLRPEALTFRSIRNRANWTWRAGPPHSPLLDCVMIVLGLRTPDTYYWRP